MSFWSTLFSWIPGLNTTNNTFDVSKLANAVQAMIANLQPVVDDVLAVTKTNPVNVAEINSLMDKIKAASVELAAQTSKNGAVPYITAIEEAVHALIVLIKQTPAAANNANILNGLQAAIIALALIDALL